MGLAVGDAVVADLEAVEDAVVLVVAASAEAGPVVALVDSAVVEEADLGEVDSASEMGVVSSVDDPAAGLKVAVEDLATEPAAVSAAVDSVVAVKADSARVDEVTKVDSPEEVREDSAEAVA